MKIDYFNNLIKIMSNSKYSDEDKIGFLKDVEELLEKNL